MSFNLNLFVTPVIALALVLWGYFHFKRKVFDTTRYQKVIGSIGLLAFFANWTWEVAQGTLYKSFEFDLLHIGFCGLASVADMLMVYILLFGFGLLYKDVFWIAKLTGSRLFWLSLVGAVGAILAEIWHTSSGNWSYEDAMPLIPIVNVGLTPVLQFLILPPLIFGLAYRYSQQKKERNE